MPTDDLLTTATTTPHDLYALLSLPAQPSPTLSDIRRAYRRAALKYHPDKVSTSTSSEAERVQAVEKFHLLQIAHDVLADEAARSRYDEARAVRARREEREKMAREIRGMREREWGGRRREMREVLERREREGEGGKRMREGNGDGGVDEQEREMRRLAEDGRRRRREREEGLRRGMSGVKDGEKANGSDPTRGAGEKEEANGHRETKRKEDRTAGVGEINRAVKLRWVRDGTGSSADTMDKEGLTNLLSRFGAVENAFLLKDKRQKLSADGKKKVVATGVVVFKSVVGAHAAVQDTARQKEEVYKIFEKVEWAEGKVPDVLARYGIDDGQRRPDGEEEKQLNGPNGTPSKPTSTAQPRPPSTFPGMGPDKTSTSGHEVDDVKPVPLFGSFASTGTPKKPASFPALGVQNNPSLEEMTLMRLRNAEKKRLETEMRQREQIQMQMAREIELG